VVLGKILGYIKCKLLLLFSLMAGLDQASDILKCKGEYVKDGQNSVPPMRLPTHLTSKDFCAVKITLSITNLKAF
jgi:predicted metal-binding protein